MIIDLLHLEGLKEQSQLEFQLNFQLEYRTSAVELPSADVIVVRRTLSDLTDNLSGFQWLDHSSIMLIFSQINAKSCTEVITRVRGLKWELDNTVLSCAVGSILLKQLAQDLPIVGVYPLGSFLANRSQVDIRKKRFFFDLISKNASLC
ncbi:hypothetical protein Tco_1105204 [Tanacetum coccineum]